MHTLLCLEMPMYLHEDARYNGAESESMSLISLK